MTTITDGYYAGWTYYFVRRGYTATIIKAPSYERLMEYLKNGREYFNKEFDIARECTWDELEFFEEINCVCEISPGKEQA